VTEDRSDRVDGPVVVVGGYGAVGRVVARTLAETFHARVVVAGRDARRAEELARTGGGMLTAQACDVSRTEDVDRVLAGAAAVVMCVERANEALATACFERGIHYVDISASVAVLEAVERLDPLAKSNGAAAVLSVGLAPGLTNVLARHCVDRLPSARSVDIAILLGLAGDHGPDSVRWTAENMSAAAGPARRARVRLPEFGRRMVHPFPFSDQYTLTRTLGKPVTTRLCFDSAALTGVLFGLRGAGFFRLLSRLGGSGLLTAASSRIRAGADRFVVQATAADAAGAQVSAAVAGNEECRATGLVAAQVAARLLRAPGPPGVHHIDQAVAARSFLHTLQPHGLVVYEGG
jgi:NAD(P)-dependent dehydrogenase (short-subunit alcohol dehydrogenase family)